MLSITAYHQHISDNICCVFQLFLQWESCRLRRVLVLTQSPVEHHTLMFHNWSGLNQNLQFVTYQDDVSGSHIVHTSSTRMELEAIKKALLWLKETPPNCSSIIIAMDSIVVLTRIRNGWLLDGWHMNDSEGVYASMMIDRLKDSSEGTRLILKGTCSAVLPVGSLRSGFTKRQLNQLRTGNLCFSTLQEVLRKFSGEDLCFCTSSMTLAVQKLVIRKFTFLHTCSFSRPRQ